MDDWQIELLNRSHTREEFCCGKPPLDDFIHNLVTQYEKRKLGRTYVAVRPGEKRVCAYYTLASGAIPFEKLPRVIARKLPKHPVPVVLLARLAVDRSVQGCGLGAELLADALRRCVKLSEQLGIFGVEVLALDGQAKNFYAKFGFEPLPENEFHLYLPLKTISTGIGPASVPEE